MSAQLFGTTLQANKVAAVAAMVIVLSGGIGAAATGVLPRAGLSGPAAQDQPLSTEVTVQPSNSSVTADESTTYDVVVENVDGGVGAYDFAVTVDNPDIASITNIELGGNPPPTTTNIVINGNGSSAEVQATLADTDDSGSVTIGTVTLSGDAAGTSDLGLRVNALGTEDGNAYTIADVTNASITVQSQTPTPEPANFTVDITEANTTVAKDETLEVTAKIKNIGDSTATQNVKLAVDGLGTLPTSVRLEGDASTVLTFRIDTQPSDTGDFSATVSSENDSDSTDVTVVEVVYWQVDFAAGKEPPNPPSYWPNDLVAGLGNLDDGFTQNPSVWRMENESQLGPVDIVDNEFKIDDAGNPREVSIRFEIEEGAEPRDLHLVVYTLPGPFDEDEIGQQVLVELDNGAFEGGETGELTVSIPQEEDITSKISPGIFYSVVTGTRND